jgi:hypothetical protein
LYQLLESRERRRDPTMDHDTGLERSDSDPLDSGPLPAWRRGRRAGGVRLEAGLCLALVAVPLVIGLVWGPYLEGGAYVAFRCAHNLAAGRGMGYHLVSGPALSADEASVVDVTPVAGRVSVSEGLQTLLRAPVYVLALTLLDRLGVPMVGAGLVLSALGWGVAAVAVYRVGRAMRRPVAGTTAAVLVGFSPVVVATLGTEVPWVVVWAWLAIGASMTRRWDVQAWALGLMLGTYLDWSTLALAGTLLGIAWIEGGRFPLWPALVVGTAALGWGLIVVADRGFSAALIARHWSSVVGQWEQGVRRLLGESEFYWLFVPLGLWGLAGLLRERQQGRWVWVLWGAWVGVFILEGGAAALGVLTTVAVCLAGLGVEWIIELVRQRRVFRLNQRALTVGLAVVCGLPLGVAQVSSLVERYLFRPVVRQELEDLAGEWLRAHSDPGATVLGLARVGYLADRSTLVWDGDVSDQAALTGLLGPLVESPTTYCVSSKGIAWDHLVRTGWFRESYASLRTFVAPYDAASPVTIWGYRYDALAKPVGANLGNQIKLLSFGTPDSVTPGAELEVRLYWEALRSPEDDYTVFVHLLDVSGQLVAGHDGPPMDGQSPTRNWLPGEIVSDVHRIVLDPGTPGGTCRLQVGMYRWPSVERLPIWDSQGVEQRDRVMILQSIEVR